MIPFRNFLPPITVLFSVVFLWGCKEAPETSTSEEDPNASLTIYTWEDYIAPEIIDSFTKESGITTEIRSFESTDEMVDQVRSMPTAYDLLIVDETIVTTLQELKLLGSLEKSTLSGLENIDPKFLDQQHDPGNEYSVPYFWGTTLIAYNKKHFPSPPQSWSALWGRDVKGKLMVYKEKNELFATTMLMLGHQMNSEDPEHINEAAEALIRQATVLEARYGSDADVREALISEEISIAMMYSGDAAYIGEDNPDIDFFLPQEGAPVWLDSMVVTRDSLNQEHAHAFISFMLRPEIAAANSNYYRFASPNTAAQPLLDAELRADARIHPPEHIMVNTDYHHPMSPEKEHSINQVMRKLLRFFEGEAGEKPAPLTAQQ